MGNINVSLVFTVTIFNQYLISANMFCEAGSVMVGNLYPRKSYSPSEGALYFVLLYFFKGVVGFREDGYSSCLGNNNRTKHDGICGHNFFKMMFETFLIRVEFHRTTLSKHLARFFLSKEQVNYHLMSLLHSLPSTTKLFRWVGGTKSNSAFAIGSKLPRADTVAS